jgi:hypothetical protein
MAEKDLKIVITADNQDAIKKIEDFSKTLDGVSVASAKTGKAQENMTSSVFKGIAAWDLLKEGIKKSTDFVMGSVNAYLEAQKAMDLVRGTVESMGKSYDAVSPQIIAFGNRMADLGVDDEAAMLSMVKLGKAAGGDMAKGMELAKLAADLTSSGIGDLQSNTDNLQKIMVGKGQRALMEYKLNLDQTASTAEILNAVQGKVTQTVEQFAGTVPGQIQSVTEAYANMREEIGGAFVASMESAFSSAGKMNDGLGMIKDTGKIVSVSIFEVVSVFKLLVVNVALVISKIMEYYTVVANAKGLITDHKKAMDNINAAFQKTKDIQKDVTDTLKGMVSPVKSLEKAQAELAQQHVKTAKTAVQVGDDITNANKQAANSYDQIKDKVKAFGKETEDTNYKMETTTRDYYEKIDKLADDHLQKVKDINKQIADENSKFTDDQSNNYTDLQKSIGETIVAHEDNKKSLESQLSDEVAKGKDASTDKISQLQKEIAAENAFLDKHKIDIAQYNLDMTAMRDLAHKDDIEKKILDYQEQKATDEKQHAERLAALQDSLNKENAAYATALAEQKRQTEEALADMVRTYTQKFAEIAEIVKGVQSLVNQVIASTSTLKVPTLSGPTGATSLAGKRASGGPVSGGGAYLVGEQGPELFVPGQSGGIVPNGDLGGGTTINIHMNGDFYTTREIAEKFANEIARQIKFRIKV